MKLMKPKGHVEVDSKLWSDPAWVADLKIDGRSGRIEFDREGNARMWGAYVEITDNMPPLCCYDLAGTTLHVEWAAGPDPSIPAREYAATLVAKDGWKVVQNPVCYVIDVPVYQGQSGRTLDARLCDRGGAWVSLMESGYPIKFREPVVVSCDGSYSSKGHIVSLIELGHEGWVLKKLDSFYVEGYSSDWRKFKPGKELDAWVVGYHPGGGKYVGLAGSLRLVLFDEVGMPVEIAACSGMPDAKRREFTERIDAGEEFVVQVSFQRWSVHGSLQHPAFQCERPDLTKESCTFEVQKGE